MYCTDRPYRPCYTVLWKMGLRAFSLVGWRGVVGRHGMGWDGWYDGWYGLICMV